MGFFQSSSSSIPLRTYRTCYGSKPPFLIENYIFSKLICLVLNIFPFFRIHSWFFEISYSHFKIVLFLSIINEEGLKKTKFYLHPFYPVYSRFYFWKFAGISIFQKHSFLMKEEFDGVRSILIGALILLLQQTYIAFFANFHASKKKWYNYNIFQFSS